MKKFTKSLIESAALRTVIGTIALFAPHAGYGQNSSSRTKDVNVVNTPNVTVANTPTVNLGARASVGINPSSNTVLVASSSRQPVLTTQTLQVVNLFQKSMEIDLPEGQALGYASFTVPGGKLLVIENVSGTAFMGGVNQFPAVSFRTTANNALAEHLLAWFLPNGLAQYPVFTFGDTFYADPGSTVELIYKREGENQTFGTSELKVTFSGRYINQ